MKFLKEFFQFYFIFLLIYFKCCIKDMVYKKDICECCPFIFLFFILKENSFIRYIEQIIGFVNFLEFYLSNKSGFKAIATKRWTYFH